VDQIGCQRRKSIVLPFGRAMFDSDVLASRYRSRSGLPESAHKVRPYALNDALLRSPISGIARCCARSDRPAAKERNKISTSYRRSSRHLLPHGDWTT